VKRGYTGLVASHGQLARRLLSALEGQNSDRAVRLATSCAQLVASQDSGELEALVYLADRSDPDADQVRRELQDALDWGARHLVVISSAEAVAPHHHHPGLIAEDHPRASAGGHPIADRWLALEAAAREVLVQQVVGERAPLTLLRPAPMPVVGGEDYWSRLFSDRFAATVAGFDPTLQLLSPTDLATALIEVLGGRLAGLYHVAPRQPIPLHKALRRSRVRRLPVMVNLAFPPATRRAYLTYSWTVCSRRLEEETAWRARSTSAEVLDAFAVHRGRPAATVHGAAEREFERHGFDGYGLDRGYIARLGRTLLGFVHDRYWRVEIAGMERIPQQGRALLVGVHRGFMPFDGVMALHSVARFRGRYPRFLIHPALSKFPFLANFMSKLGGVLACQENADHVLEGEGLLGVYPEGIRGAFTPYKRAYKLGRFGRDEFVKTALRHQAPIVPFVTVGSAEIFPILGAIRWRWLRRLTEWPYFPITPTLNLVPLPSKWHTWFLEPIHVEADHPPEAADDPEVVRRLSMEVRQRMEAAIAEMLERRKAIFWGSIFTTADGRQPRAVRGEGLNLKASSGTLNSTTGSLR